MTSNALRHFNTAKTIALTAMLAYNNSYAHESNNAINCELLPKITPFTNLPPHTSDLMWFTPNSNAVHDKKTLSIMPADRSELWYQGSYILTRLPSNWDLIQPDNQLFYIVRSKNMRSNKSRRPFGQVMRVIGVAQIKENLHAINDVNEHSEITRILRIIQSSSEVTRQDRLVPKSCLHTDSNTTHHPSLTTPAPTKKAHVLAFLNEYYIGAKGSIILISKGSKSGVSLNQTWLLIDELPNQPISSKAFGSAQVLQVFENVSVLQITQTSHEVRPNTLLKFSAKP